MVLFLYYINPGTVFNITLYSENIYFLIHLTFLIYIMINKDKDIAIKDLNRISYVEESTSNNISNLNLFIFLKVISI